MKTLTLLPALALLCSCSLGSAEKIFVSGEGNDLNSGSRSEPLRSIEAAQQAVREMREKDPGRSVKVILGAGSWYIDKPLFFVPADGGSGKANVTWEGRPDGATVISGGALIEGFRDEGYGIWWAPVDSTRVFEQLYVNGVRATRARYPNMDDPRSRIYLDHSAWVYNQDSTVKNIYVTLHDSTLTDRLVLGNTCEVVIFKDWTISRFHVSGLTSGPAALLLKPPFALFDGPYNSIFAGNANRYSCYLEGDPTLLDQPGEWALDTAGNRMFYKPLPGQTHENVEVIAPLAQQLVVIKGGPDSPVRNLEFRSIRFENAAYLLPEYNHDGMQAAFYYPGNSDKTTGPGLIPPAIEMAWAENCRVTGCTLRNIGGNGIYLREGCRNNRVKNSIAEDIGGNGIMIGLTFDPKADSLLLPVNNVVTGSTIHNCGVGFHGSVGIWLGFCAGNEISDCEVYDLPYTGISVGWQWNPQPTSSKNNRILNNRIHHAMQMLGDGGGIYTLGFQPGSVISGNEIHDILRSELNHASDNNGMFIDEGSKGYRIENNTIRNTAHTSIRGHRASGVELIGNTFYSGDQAAVSHTPPYEAMIFVNKDTTVSWENPGWPVEWGYPEMITAFTMKGNRFFK